MAEGTTNTHSRIRIYYGNVTSTGAPDVLADLTDSIAGDISLTLGGTVTTERRHKTSGTGRIGMRAFGESADQCALSFPAWLGPEVSKVLNNPDGRVWMERLDSGSKGRVTVIPCFVPTDVQNAPVPGGQQIQLQFMQAVFTHPSADVERGVVVGDRDSPYSGDTVPDDIVLYLRTASGIGRYTGGQPVPAGLAAVYSIPLKGEAEA